MQEQLQPLLVHLLELRTRLVRGSLVFIVAFLACFAVRETLYNFVAAPLTNVLPTHQLISFGIAAPFMVQIKVAAMVAFLISLPHTLYQIWAFVAPGLYAHEKKLVLPLVVSSSLLFLAGMAFAYYFVFGVVFRFIASVVPASMQWLPDSAEYLDFILSMFLAFGVTFEVPVFVVVLVRMGFVSVEKLREWRPYVIVGAFVIAAVVTPPDVMSQLLLAIPLWLLFEVGCMVAAWTGKPAAKELTPDS
ncbi:Sec-independent protein translocase protein TatC [Andreprevotia sp. IGB-42]|uniref:twin-arginine translocase subunit TatC n=1 Tax=Andreprevotia sp. IGB-42 TaxID=2497473 RepID=UPI00135737FF|nr:twin-arginine translocase subunit TatC [Andreprevotia sp. IGB-42]KAF0814661.1 Sec-independent protein translocase protein TatC [Andreprevotia sp. IGB-42]